jgi:hypothetical protein
MSIHAAGIPGYQLIHIVIADMAGYLNTRLTGELLIPGSKVAIKDDHHCRKPQFIVP